LALRHEKKTKKASARWAHTPKHPEKVKRTREAKNRHVKKQHRYK